MKIYVIGICGTFMGGVARLARDLGHEVSGSDANTYPPMSTQLESLGIDLFDGYDANNINLEADIIVIGNTISRGNPELEKVLDTGLAYTSGAQWLSEHVLQDRWVLGVAGTHGKTTTASLLAWILQDNQLAPGFLIGGVPENFGESARIGGDTPFFVIEADEYDTAFCDKRSKFIHYRPRTLVLNNLEFDHADIFSDLAAIQTQFHHLLKTIPSNGKIIYNQQTSALSEVLEMGCWSELSSFGLDSNADWSCEKISDDASEFYIVHQQVRHFVKSAMIGEHNMFNALAGIAAAHHVGIRIEDAVQSLTTFRSVKRRLEIIFDDEIKGRKVRVYDDFAHHPTAITQTLNALRAQREDEHIIAVLEPRSNTMKRGVHKHLLKDSLQSANISMIFANNELSWDVTELGYKDIQTFDDSQKLLDAILSCINQSEIATNIIIMSNGGFENLHQRLLDSLKSS